MPDMDDFYAFQNTKGSGSGPGCSGKVLFWSVVFVVVVVVVCLIGR